METKKLVFIIRNYGCMTRIGGKDVLTNLGNVSRVLVEDFWNAFSSDAEKIFEIRPIEDKKE